MKGAEFLNKAQKLNTFWPDFSDIMTKLLGVRLPFDPQTCLLGDTTNIDA